MTSIVLFAKRILTVNATTSQAQNLINQVLTSGANIYTYIGVRVNADLYRDVEIRRLCNLLSRDDLRDAGDRVSDILYTSSFGRKSDPILGYVTLTLEAPNIIAPGARVQDPALVRRKTARLFYNKNTTSPNSLALNLAQRERIFTLQGVIWALARVSARPERITRDAPRPQPGGNPASAPGGNPPPVAGPSGS